MAGIAEKPVVARRSVLKRGWFWLTLVGVVIVGLIGGWVLTNYLPLNKNEIVGSWVHPEDGGTITFTEDGRFTMSALTIDPTETDGNLSSQQRFTGDGTWTVNDRYGPRSIALVFEHGPPSPDPNLPHSKEFFGLELYTDGLGPWLNIYFTGPDPDSSEGRYVFVRAST